jgi:hypothetical protein
MLSRAIAFFAALSVVSTPVVADAADVDDPRHYLEGIWLIGAPPDQGPCVSHWYSDMQIEFEFRKTGGRVQVFEPNDLFSAIEIDLQQGDDEIALTAQTPEGAKPFLRLKVIAPDKFELLPLPDSSLGKAPQIAYRCGSPDWSVTGSVPLERLSILTPEMSGGLTLVERTPGASSEETCVGRRGARWLQFELLGPVHFWALGGRVSRPVDVAYDYVRSVQHIDDRTLKLQMQEHLELGNGWDVAESRGRHYELTIVYNGEFVEIPELSATFARCSQIGPGSTSGQ